MRYTITFDVELTDDMEPKNGILPGSDRWWQGPWTPERFLSERLHVVPELREWQHEFVKIGPIAVSPRESEPDEETSG